MKKSPALPGFFIFDAAPHPLSQAFPNREPQWLRSAVWLGSASALKLAYRHSGKIDGLVLESAFVHTGSLLRRVGVAPAALVGFEESQRFQQLDKIRTFAKPTLVIHAKRDHLIPFADGQALYDASPAPDKHLLKILRVDHNTLVVVGLQCYLDSVENFADPRQLGSAA